MRLMHARPPSHPPAHIPRPVFKDVKLRCRRCSRGDELYPYWASPANRFNPRRQYFMCGWCQDDEHSRGRFVCWGDDRGVSADNPACRCGIPSREGVTTGRTGLRTVGRRFWSCAVGRCDFDEKEDLRDTCGRLYGA